MLQISIFNPKQHVQRCVDASTVTLGSSLSDLDHDQLQIQIDDELVSDTQCRVELLDQDGIMKLAIYNLGRCIVLGDGNRLHQGVSDELDLPCSIYAGDSQIEISIPSTLESLDKNLKRIPVSGAGDAEEPVISQNRNLSPAPSTLNSWFEAMSQMNRSTASQASFYKLAARAVFNPGGLDGCIILKRNGDDWTIVSQHLPYPDYGISYRSDLVDEAANTACVLYHPSMSPDDAKESGQQHSVVVCPVLDADDNITTMVYAFRCNHRHNNRCGIRDLEAKFVSLIADTVSAGLIRLSHEASGARRRVLLEQAFSPRVAERLESNPEFPTVENREVSILFADIRSFCKITEKLGCHLTYHLLSDVMDRFTAIIHEHNGVVIDYYGDGISAFWNAPVDQPDHPLLACRAAREITRSLEDLNAKWMKEIGRKLKIGVGVTTGHAQIGNSGSSWRLKYGPQGTTVNIASRLEQSTKKTGVSFVVSGETAKRVQSEFTGNRICTANFPGINRSIEVVQLYSNEELQQHSSFISDYQQALACFEEQNYLEALELLINMSEAYPEQPLVEFLLATSVKRLTGTGIDNEVVAEAIQRLGQKPAEIIEITSAVSL